jgi:hypothetical protein
MNDIRALTSRRFHASAKASNISMVISGFASAMLYLTS